MQVREASEGDRGVGNALIAPCIERVRRAGHGAHLRAGAAAVLWPLGFSVEAARPFRGACPADCMMALSLEPGALDVGGALIYPAPFAAL